MNKPQKLSTSLPSAAWMEGETSLLTVKICNRGVGSSLIIMLEVPDACVSHFKRRAFALPLSTGLASFGLKAKFAMVIAE